MPNDIEDRELAKLLRQVERDDESLPAIYSSTLLPDESDVDVQLDRVDVGRMGPKLKWYGHFVIIEAGEFQGLPILRAWNAPRSGSRLHPSHKLYLDYEKITGLRPPPIPAGKKPERFLNLFLSGVVLRARTRVVERRMDEKTRTWIERPKETWYSVIDQFGGDGGSPIVAGRPFVLRGRRS